MRGRISAFLIFMFLSSLSCTSVDVNVALDRSTKTPSTVLPQPINVSATDETDLPQKHLCHLDIDVLCPAEELAIVQPCSAPEPDKTPPVAQFSVGGCWAASSEAVSAAHGRKIAQCEGVNQVLGRGDCCLRADDQPPGPCQQNGWPYEIFNENGFAWKWVSGPLSREAIAGQLCAHGSFIFVLRLNGGGSHTFVVKDAKVIDGKMSLLVHDHSWSGNHPHAGGPPTEYKEWPYEKYKNGVWYGEQHTNDSSFVAIRPL